ncbi:MAG: lysylphosphatidylglycerol synthase transmembrane domain-containing protein [bacterium]|nr:lysylphosphatidylglycerol synthase transmembrane domain-containing protein [bacterium]
MRKYRNQLIAGVLIVLVIYILVLLVFDSTGQFDEGVFEALAKFPVALLVVLAITQISANTFRFLTWQYYIGVVGARDKISIKDSAIIFISSFMFSVSPGKVAELLKAVLLKMKTGVPIARSAPIVLAERIGDGASVVVTLTATLLIGGENLPLGDYYDISRGIVFSSAAIILGGLIVVQIQPLAHFFLNILAKIPFINRLHGWFVHFYESSREIFSIRHMIPVTILGMGVYMSSTVGFFIILWGFGLEMTPTLFLQTAFIVGVASAVGALSFVPNGAGVTELTNFAMLMAVVAPQNPILTVLMAGAAALLQGFFHKWFRVLVGVGVAFIYRNRLFTGELEAELATMEAEHHQKIVAEGAVS